MGLVKTGALSTTVRQSNAIVWDVPQSWTLQQAATVPYSYFLVKRLFFFIYIKSYLLSQISKFLIPIQATYALIYKGKLSESKNVLIFAGGNSVNYAAISIALSLKCKVFVVAETNEQLEIIKNNYPEVSHRNVD